MNYDRIPQLNLLPGLCASSNVLARSARMLEPPAIPSASASIPEADVKTTPAASADVKNDAKDEPPKEPKAEMNSHAIIDAVVVARPKTKSMKKAIAVARVEKQPVMKRPAASAVAKKKKPLMKRPATVGGRPHAVAMPPTAKRFSPIKVGQATIYYSPGGFRLKAYPGSRQTKLYRYSQGFRPKAVAWKCLLEDVALANK